MRVFLFALFFIGACTFVAAQKILYPVREGHKWGFMDKRGKVLIKPQYDAFSDINLPWNRIDPALNQASGFRLVLLNGKTGLIDGNLQEVLPCRYKRIRPLTMQYFAVETDSLFTVVNRAGEQIINAYYDDICPIDDNPVVDSRFFLVKKNNKWGVHRNKGELVIPPSWADLRVAQRSDYFKVKASFTDTTWALIDIRNKPVLPAEFQDIAVYAPGFIGVKQFGAQWTVLDERLQPLLKPEWLYINPISRRLVSMRNSMTGEITVFDVFTKKAVDTDDRLTDFSRLDGNLSICIQGRLWGLMDSNAVVQVQPQYDSIKLSGFLNILAVSKEKKWGLYDLRRNEAPKAFKYLEIRPFIDSIALCRTDLGWGAINYKGEEVVPAYFSSLTREGRMLEAYSGLSLRRFEIRPGAKVSLTEDFGEVGVISIGKSRINQYVEASVLRPAAEVSSSPPAIFQTNFIASLDSQLIWRRDYAKKLWELVQRNKGAETVLVPAKMVSVVEMIERRLVAVYKKEKPVKTEFTKNFGYLRGSLARMSMYSFEEKKIVSETDMLGVRIRDFLEGRNYAAFIDTNGRMGLIDRSGKQKLGASGSPLRFSYIGKFVKGKARVCVGGVLKKDANYENRSLSVGTVNGLVQEFFLREPVTDQYVPVEAGLDIYLDAAGAAPPKWGFINESGDLLMEPLYQYVSDVQEDSSILILKDKMMGVMNYQHKVVVEPRYRSIISHFGRYKVTVPNPSLFYFNNRGYQLSDVSYKSYRGFSDGMCGVRLDSLWGFINTAGKETIACKYDSIRPFSGGLAAVKTGGTWVFIDTTGAIAFEPRQVIGGPVEFKNFKEDRCRFRQDKLWGYFNAKGEVVISPRYAATSDFSCGVAAIRQRGKAGIVDINGEYILDPVRFDEIQPFNEFCVALAREKKDGPLGVLNNKGELIAPLKYQQIDKFIEGYARVRNEQGWGVINRLGKELIAPQYAKIDSLSDGVIAVQPKGADYWVYVDTLNRQVISRRFSKAGPFMGGLAEVNDGQVINRKGEFIQIRSNELHVSEGVLIVKTSRKDYFADAGGNNLFGRLYDDVKPFRAGIASAKKGAFWGGVNHQGIYVIQPKFNQLHAQRDGNLIVRPPVLYGLVDRNGKVLIEPKFDRLEKMFGNLYRVELGEKVGYLSDKGEWIWQMKN